MGEIKICLVDDKEIFRKGLSRLLQEQSDIQLVYQSGINCQLFQWIQATEADVLLIDVDIEQKVTWEALRQINHQLPGTKIIVLTDSQEKVNFSTAIEIGARGYLSKDVPFEELLDSIRMVASGELVVSPIFSHQFLFNTLRADGRSADTKLKDQLSEREIEVLGFVTHGATNREIAEQLFISENTVKVHLKKLLDKLQLRNRQQLAVYAVQQGLATPVSEKIGQGGKY